MGLIKMGNITKGIKKFNNPNLTPMEKLKALISKIYCLLLDFMAHTIKPLLYLVMDVSASPGSPRKSGNSSKGDMSKLTIIFTNFIATFQQTHIHDKVVQHFFLEVFYFVNATIFNELMLRRDLCTFSTGMEYKMKVTMLEGEILLRRDLPCCLASS